MAYYMLGLPIGLPSLGQVISVAHGTARAGSSLTLAHARGYGSRQVRNDKFYSNKTREALHSPTI